MNSDDSMSFREIGDDASADGVIVGDNLDRDKPKLNEYEKLAGQIRSLISAVVFVALVMTVWGLVFPDLPNNPRIYCEGTTKVFVMDGHFELLPASIDCVGKEDTNGG